MSACSSLTQRTPTGWIVSAAQSLFSWFLVWPLEMRVPSQRCLFLMLNWTSICTGVQCNMEYENAPLCKLPQFRLCTTCFVYYINSWMYTESQILEYIQLFFTLSCFVKLSQQHRQLSTKTNLTAQIRQVFWQGNCTEWWRTRSVILSAIILIIDASHQAKKK